MRLFFPITFIILAGLLFFFIVDPLYKDVRDLRGDLATYNTALDHSKNLQLTRDSLLDTYKNISKEDKERLDRFLPNTVNNIKFILEVEQVANVHNMPIKNIKFETQKDTEGTTGKSVVTASDSTNSLPYGIFPIEFTTEGKYDDFVLFLKDLEYNLRLVDIRGVNFTVPAPSTKPGDTSDTIYTYSLKVQTYWLK